MRKAIAVVAVLVLAISITKIMVAPSKSAADTKSLMHYTMSVYDLHVGYPDMKVLAVEKTPLP
jgi:hypothetical protein